MVSASKVGNLTWDLGMDGCNVGVRSMGCVLDEIGISVWCIWYSRLDLEGPQSKLMVAYPVSGTLLSISEDLH